MGKALYVERETYPSVIPGEEVMVIARDRGSFNLPARAYIVALDPGTTFEHRHGNGTLTDRFTAVSVPVTLGRGERSYVDFSAAQAADHNVIVIRCLTGRLAVTTVSAHRIQMQFRSRGRRSA